MIMGGCATSQVLPTHSGPVDLEAPGTFDLILYGMQNGSDFETVAVLDRRGDAYKIEPVTMNHVRRFVEDVPAAEASQMAHEFLRRLLMINTVASKKIMGPDGAVIGYELRPIFHEFQAPNRYYRVWYFLAEPEIVKFRVEWLHSDDSFPQD